MSYNNEEIKKEAVHALAEITSPDTENLSSRLGLKIVSADEEKKRSSLTLMGWTG